MRLEEILIALAFVVAFAITGTMDSQDAEIASSTAHPALQEIKP